MKRLLAMLLALALLLSGLALAEETELEPVLEDVAVEAEVEAVADGTPAEEEGEILPEEELGEANEGESIVTLTVKNKKTYTLEEGETVQLAVAWPQVAMIVQLPGPTAVTMPSSPTIATLSSLVRKVTGCSQPSGCTV